nr:hypothetical protein CFP56_02610 [Quercus suber]
MARSTRSTRSTTKPKRIRAIKMTANQQQEQLIERELKLMKGLYAITKGPGNTVNVAEHARRAGVSYSRLKRRWRGISSLAKRPPSHTRLSLLQEKALVEYCDLRDRIGLGIPMSVLADVANSILKQSVDDEGFKVKQKPIELARKEAHDPANIEAWHVALQALIEDQRIRPHEIYNFDETGFQIGIGGTKWILSMDTKRRAWSPSETNRKHVTVVEAVNAARGVIPPMFIASGLIIQERWFEGLTEGDSLLGVIDSGYINDQLALEWIKHFERCTRSADKPRTRLLICDNYGSHCFFEFLRYAKEHDIVVFGLPPHTSHFLQLLDVVLFQPYKHYHRRAVNKATRTGCQNFNLVEFFSAIESIRRNTFAPHNIRAAFRKTGIWPANSRRSISFLREEYAVDSPAAYQRLENEIQCQCEEQINRRFEGVETATQSEEAGEAEELIVVDNEWHYYHQCCQTPANRVRAARTSVTPTTIRGLQSHGVYIVDRLLDYELSSPTQQMLDQYVHSSQIAIIRGEQAAVDLAATEAAVRARQRRQAASQRAVQKGGVISVNKARRLVKQAQHERQEVVQNR